MSASVNDIVFTFPPAYNHVGSFAGHLGVGYLRAALAKSGIKSCQYLNPRPGTIGEVVRDLFVLKPGMIGFTAYNANFPLCLSIAKRLKQQPPGMKIVFGGPSVTFGSKELLARHEAIDLCIRGEAEETAPRVLANLLDGVFPEDDQVGVAFRRDGKIICAADPPLVGATTTSVQSSLDVAPSPYLSEMMEDGRTGLLTGRGCTHQCQYCCFAALGKKKLRLHSVERVLAELEFIAAHQQRTGQHYVVPFHDDAFTLLPERAKRLCETIINRGLELTLSCVTRADAVDDELLKVMRAAGFVSLAFGLESAVPSVLRATGKIRPPDWPDRDLAPERHFVEQVRKSVISAKKLGFSVGVSIILGLPTETAADGEATLRFIRTLPIDYYAHNLLCLLPGTPLWDTRAHYDLDCSIDEMGLPATTEYAYDVKGLRPSPKCALENDASVIRILAADAIHDCETVSASEGSISTVVIEAEELTAETAEWLHKVLAVGGIVLQLYSLSNCKQRDRRIHRDRRMMNAHLVPDRHYIQVERMRTRVGNNRYVIACSNVDLYRTHKTHLVSITSTEGPSPMFDWLRGMSTSCELCEVTPALLQSTELARLMHRIDAEPERSPLQRMSIPPRFQYSGRWLKGTASCKSLNRVEVNREGKVRCCRFGDSIGKVGDTKEDLRKCLSELLGATEQRRGCHLCTRTECPRCPFPGLDDQTYCGTMMQCAPVLRALSWIRLYSRLPSTVARQRDWTAAE